MVLQATTGVSASVTPNCLRSRSTCGSVSTSTHVKSTRFLARKSRTRKVSGEYRDPMTRRPVKSGDWRKSCRLAMNAWRMMSLKIGHWFRACLSASLEISYT